MSSASRAIGQVDAAQTDDVIEADHVPERQGVAAEILNETVASGALCEIDARETPPSAPNPSGRDARGRFQPGNLAAVSHALRATTLPADLAHLPAEIDAWMADCEADEGTVEEIPTRRRALLNYRGRLHRRILQLDTALELRGLLDKRGKLRVAWLQQLSSLITTAKTLDTLLGLERRQKRIDLARLHSGLDQ